MGKKAKGKATRQRDAPVVAVTAFDLWRTCLDEGYIPLSECPEVRMCVNAYADLISNMTVHLMKNTPQGDVRVVNELSRKVDIAPSRGMNRKAWVWNIVNILLTSGNGNCVVLPRYDRDGYLQDLTPLDPASVVFEDAPGGYRIVYGDAVFSPDEVLHFAINPDPHRPWLGTGMRVSLRDAVKSIRQAGSTKDALMSSPVPSVIVKVDGLSDEMQSKEGRDKIAAQYVDDSRNGRPWIIASEFMAVEQVKPLTIADLAIRDNIELDRRTIAGVFGVPPHMVGVGTYNEAEREDFINTRLMGLAQYIQQELTAKLLYSPDYYWRFNPRSLYNYKLADIITAGAEMVDRMAMRRNEWRDWIGLAPDEEMNDLLALENYIPADRLGDQKKLKGGDGGDE